MEFYWVNIGETYQSVVDQRFLWAPMSSVLPTGREVTRVHWHNVSEVKAGDVIFCYYEQRICFLARATADSHQSVRPNDSSFNAWDRRGFQVDVEIIDLDKTVSRDEISAEFIRRFNHRTSPSIFKRNAEVNLIYMAHLPVDAGLFLLEAVGQFKLAESYFIESGSSTGKKIPKTTREALVAARIGQGKFRSDLIDRWDGMCALTGLKTVDILIASHIHAWALCDNMARLDPDNGLLLAPHIDRLFDLGIISFSDKGQLQIKDSLGLGDRHVLGLDRFTRLRKINPGNVTYLEKHRSRFDFI
jgi:putative restriction endonuclease